AFLFQPRLEIRSEVAFVPRPDLGGGGVSDWDARVSELHYADTPAYATGHGVSVDWDLTDDKCNVLRTAWVPKADVEKTETVEIDGVETRMAGLGSLSDGEAARAALAPLVERYREWIKRRGNELDGLAGPQKDTAEELLRRAGLAADRIETGIDLLAGDQY